MWKQTNNSHHRLQALPEYGHLPYRLEKILILLAFSLPLSIFIIAVCFLLLVKRVPGFHQDQVGELVPIYAQQSLTQTLILEQSGLDTVMVFLKNARLDNRDKFVFQILDHQIVISGYNIGDGDTVRFQFPPLNLPAGSQVSFTLTAPDTANPDLAVKAGVSPDDAYPPGQLSGRFAPRDLSFQLFYQPNSRQELLVSGLDTFIKRLTGQI